MANLPSWIDTDRVAAAKRQLPQRSAQPRVKTLKGSRPSLANVAVLKEYTRAHAYAKSIDGIDVSRFGTGFKSYMRHAR